MENMTTARWAYLAGLIDGEGSIECQQEMHPKGTTPRFVLRLSFTFATEEPLATITQWLGVSYKQYPATDERRSPRYRCQIPKSLAVVVLEHCLPFLILKRDQAELILEIERVRAAYSPDRRLIAPGKNRTMPTAAIEQMTVLHAQLRALKSNKRRMDAPVNRAA